MMEFLHTMVRVGNLDQALDFYCNKFGLVEVRRVENEKARYTLVFLAAPGDVEKSKESRSPLLELTYNWDENAYQGGRNFGHLAYRVDDIYETRSPRRQKRIVSRITRTLSPLSAGPILKAR